MPKITIEYSDNIKFSEFKTLAHDLHLMLSKMLPTKMENCETRIIKHKDYLIGEGGVSSAFINVGIAVMTGRNTEVLNDIGKAIFLLLPTSIKCC